MKTAQNVDFNKYNNRTLGIERGEVKFVDIYKQDNVDNTENIRLLEKCRFYWDSLMDFRERRGRARDYYRGDQWSDTVLDDDGNSISEEDHIKNQGRVPLKQNIIRQIVKNLIGQYRGNPTKSQVIARAKDDGTVAEMLSNALQAAKRINKADDLDARMFEEFLMSGAPIQKVSYRFWHERDREDLYLENCNPQRMFFNSGLADVRMHDLNLIGQIMDTTLEDVIVGFARNPRDAEKIREWYLHSQAPAIITQDGLSKDKLDYLDFYIPQEDEMCRVYEIWQQKMVRRMLVHDPLEAKKEMLDVTAEEIMMENRRRIEWAMEQGVTADQVPLVNFQEKYEKVWFVKFLTPNGNVLWEGETPYSHQSHPYAIQLYPLLDGEVWGMVEDIIDQQRYINRLIIMLDFIISASAKGVLLVPADVIPKDMDITDFADSWSQFNGVIKYKPSTKHQKVPEQIAANSTNIGIHEMLAYQMNFLQEVSGVHSAIQGKDPKSGTPSSLYAQEAQNATINSVDYMEVFNSFKEQRDVKALKVITQFYQEERYLAIAGSMYKDEAALYNPKIAGDIDWDLVVEQGMDTPVYRTLIEETLARLLEAQAIDIESYLENSTMPFADKLLQSIKKKQEEIMQGIQGGAGMPPEMAQFAQSADPRAMQMLQKATGGPM